MRYTFLHTRGPWKTHGRFVVITGWMKQKTYPGICNTNNKDYAGLSLEEKEANAKLISIAPDMADFIDEVLYHFRNGGYDNQTVFGKLYEKGEKLITKIAVEK